MRIKKYNAASMKEALLKIKQDLGEDAMILKTRKIPKKLFSIGAQDEIEVTAAVDDSVSNRQQPLRPLKISDTGVYKRPSLSQKETVEIHRQEITGYTSKRQADDMGIDRLRFLGIQEDIREIKDLIKSILQTGETAAAGGFAGPWAVLYKRLVDAEIKPETAQELISSIKGKKNLPDSDVDKKFIEVLSGYFQASGPLKLKSDGPLIVAFVGPTGSGKTTTLAKLAAHYSLEKDNVVSIITADTYRIAAIEQIRTFADIVNIGLQVVFSPEEAEDVLRSCENDDIVFIDTAGRSPQHPTHMRELEEFINVLSPDEIHLVLSASTKESDLDRIIKKYHSVGVNRLVFTKLDETYRLGNVFNSVRNSGIPVSYFTAGQSVPEDIELAQPGRFIKRLWEGSSV